MYTDIKQLTIGFVDMAMIDTDNNIDNYNSISYFILKFDVNKNIIDDDKPLNILNKTSNETTYDINDLDENVQYLTIATYNPFHERFLDSTKHKLCLFIKDEKDQILFKYYFEDNNNIPNDILYITTINRKQSTLQTVTKNNSWEVFSNIYG